MANTTNYALTKPTVGGDADVWGGYLNTNWDDADALFSAIATTGSANAYVLTTGLSLAAYATGQKFTIIPNFTNSGAATINVDAIGAKNIYKNSAGTKGAVASGDIVSGVPIDIVYDGTQFVTNLSHAAQPLDATLTALAALSWSSGNPVVQFTAADTISLTLTPSVTSLTLSGALTAGTNSLISGSSGAHGAATLAVVATSGGASDYVFGVYGDNPENSTNGDFLVTRAGDVGIGGALTISNTVPTFDLYDSDAGSDGKLWRQRIIGGEWRLQTATDAGSSTDNAITCIRSGTSVTGVKFGATIYPDTDNTFVNGAIAYRWTDIFAVSGSVNTSDAREKTPLQETPEALRRIVRRIFQRCGLYRWKFMGDDAPWSYGVTAQIVEEEFAAEGLDAHDYHLFEEGDLPGNEDQPTRKCLRPDQLFYLGISTLMSEA